MSHIIAYINPLILQNTNFAIQDGSMQLDRTTSDQLIKFMIRIPLDQSDQVYDHGTVSPRLIKLP